MSSTHQSTGLPRHEITTQQLSRRTFTRILGMGIISTASIGLLSACGDEPAVEEETTGSGSEPTEELTDEEQDQELATPENNDDTDEQNDDEVSENSDDAPVHGGTLVYGLDSAPLSFDPHYDLAYSSMSFYEHIYESLFYFNEDLELIPQLCESYEVIDSVTYEFTLREGVSFHNGDPLTVEDVIFSFERMMDDSGGSVRSSWFTQVDTIEVVDDRTVRFSLIEPYAPLLSFLGMQGAAIVSRATVEEFGDLQQETNGTGPFQLDDYQPDQGGTLTRFDDYWESDLPYLDAIDVVIQADESTRVASIRSEEVHFSRLYDVQNADILESEGYTIFQGLSTAHAISLINCRREPLSDPRVRQALSFAINRQDFIDAAVQGEGEPTGPIPSSDNVWALDPSQFETFSQDIERAQQLLEEAGVGDGFELDLVISPQYAFDVSNAQVLQAQLQQLNIQANIRQLEWGNLLQNLTSEQDFDILNIIGTHQPDPDGYTWSFFHSESATNYAGIANDELDNLLDRGRETPDVEERREIYAEVQQMLVDELVPWLTYYVYKQYMPAQPSVKGFQPIPSLSRYYLRETWLEE